MHTYTLKQLAHFDRCLFSDDFAKEMVSIGGYDADMAFILRSDLRAIVDRGGCLGVVQLYQTYGIGNQEFENALELVLQDFVKKFP